MGWISPTGHLEGAWTNEAQSYDGNVGSGALGDSITETAWLELTHVGVLCDNIRFNIAWCAGSPGDTVHLDAYYSGAYQAVYHGTFSKEVWVESGLGGTYVVTKVRIKIFGGSGADGYPLVYEVQLNNVVVAPTVTTQPATNVEPTTATLRGTITNTGGQNCSERGFAYTKETPVDWQYVWDTGSFEAGAFTKGISSLSPETNYVFRSYATNTVGTGWGALTYFTTPAVPISVTVAVPFFNAVGSIQAITITVEFNSLNVTVNVPLLSAVGSVIIPAIIVQQTITISAIAAQGISSVFSPEITISRNVFISATSLQCTASVFEAVVSALALSRRLEIKLELNRTFNLKVGV